MSDPSDEQATDGPPDAAEGAPEDDDTERSAEPNETDESGETDERGLDELAERVEEKYDFEEFGPYDMAEMTAEEWEAAFDHDSWITGRELLDRVESELKHRVDTREVFAVVERLGPDEGGEPAATGPEGQPSDGVERLVAYSDEGYAIVYPDGSVEGRGTVVRDVKPSVALCSMEEYDVPEMPDEAGLPDPVEVPEGSGELGNFMLQIVAGVKVLAGLALIGVSVWVAVGGPSPFETGGVGTLISGVIGLVFLAIGAFLFLTVANARLSDRFRSEEFRNRLRAAGVDSEDRPEFLPIEEDGSAADEESPAE